MPRTFSISFPDQLAEQVERVAQEESRTLSELFREAFRSYRADRIRKVLDQSNALSAVLNPEVRSENDVARVVQEYRREKRSRKRVGRARKVPA